MYGKVFSSMYDGTLATRGPWQALVTFQQLIVLSDRDGVVDMTTEAIARRTSIPLEIIETGIAALLHPDPRSRTPAEDGRRIIPLEDHRDWGWQIVNHAKYQAMRSAEERREYLRVAQANRREKLKGLSTTVNNVNNVNRASTMSTVSTPTPTDVPADTPADVKEKEKRASAPRVTRSTPMDRPREVLEQVWDDWLALRRAKKAPVTATVLESARVEANKAGLPLETFLRIWCARGSQGLEADWLKPHERGNSGNGGEPQWVRERKAAVAAYGGAPRISGSVIDMEDANATRPKVG